MVSSFVLVFLSLCQIFELLETQSICADQAYFNYECSQLARYCRVNRAVGIRQSCPLTCGLCQKDQTNLVPPKDNNERGIVRLIGPDEDKVDSEIENIKINEGTATPSDLSESTTVSREETTAFEEVTSHTDQPGVVLIKPISSNDKISDIEANERFKHCCKLDHIGPNCESLCSYDIKKENVLLKAATGMCTMQDAKIWLRCASGGKKNAECCHSRNVIVCDDACNGQLNSDVIQLLGCLNQFFHSIVSCHKDNL